MCQPLSDYRPLSDPEGDSWEDLCPCCAGEGVIAVINCEIAFHRPGAKEWPCPYCQGGQEPVSRRQRQ